MSPGPAQVPILQTPTLSAGGQQPYTVNCINITHCEVQNDPFCIQQALLFLKRPVYSSSASQFICHFLYPSTQHPSRNPVVHSQPCKPLLPVSCISNLHIFPKRKPPMGCRPYLLTSDISHPLVVEFNVSPLLIITTPYPTHCPQALPSLSSPG